MVVDTSALVAALSGERRASAVLDALAADPTPSLSTGTLLEASIAMQARYGDDLFAYGLASLRADALLLVGEAFAKRDVAPAPHAGS